MSEQQHDVLDDSAAVLPFPARTPHAPYYAVIFSSTRTDGDHGYGAMADRMVELARTMPGFLGIESVRDEAAVAQGRPGITVSYWSSLEAIHEWKNQAEHRVAQQQGRDQWYAAYHLRISRIEYDYGFVR
ncbi:antibiotic biosynthesis monooxygenase family protein [Ralstonia solanacearum]|nr:antibiotic biosynthesis monooxygenase [Ralstonia solanacearum]AMP68524.1 antibiotic biosynthesis monooxygenase [Ralstonia solanacearum]AMP74566.1 antibiotic biosynthesis monooxygenase [Ralstonia solanacearum]AST30966.2 antibiotic biosynthesis monooxygenase [Ralstonia solanacearum]ATJ87447.1 antibiotic biosynthesis monooxygenase [Ralstonia solanacearum]AYB52709.1 antibiotic biosynthesis monooxygenase [Ralstonia solanacearum]